MQSSLTQSSRAPLYILVTVFGVCTIVAYYSAFPPQDYAHNHIHSNNFSNKKSGLGASLARNDEGTTSESAPKEAETKKRNCELNYWQKRQSAEGRLNNDHYAKLYTDAWNVTIDFYRNKRVLDVGCGPRGSLEFLKGSGAQLLGLDPLARDYAKLGADQQYMTYIAAPAENMPFIDGSFDIVTSMNSLDHVTSLEKVANEMMRVLKPGGDLIIQAHINKPFTDCEPSPFTAQMIKDVFRDVKLTHFSVWADGPSGAVLNGQRMADNHAGPATGLFMFTKEV